MSALDKLEIRLRNASSWMDTLTFAEDILPLVAKAKAEHAAEVADLKETIRAEGLEIT